MNINEMLICDHTSNNRLDRITTGRLSTGAMPIRYNIFIMTLKIYSIQVSGIKCTNCAAKIKK